MPQNTKKRHQIDPRRVFGRFGRKSNQKNEFYENGVISLKIKKNALFAYVIFSEVGL
jgi:hypothetical protein